MTRADAVLVFICYSSLSCKLPITWWHSWVWGHGWTCLRYSLNASLCASINLSHTLMFWSKAHVHFGTFGKDQSVVWEGKLDSWLILPFSLWQSKALFAVWMGQILLMLWLSRWFFNSYIHLVAKWHPHVREGSCLGPVLEVLHVTYRKMLWDFHTQHNRHRCPLGSIMLNRNFWEMATQCSLLLHLDITWATITVLLYAEHTGWWGRILSAHGAAPLPGLFQPLVWDSSCWRSSANCVSSGSKP